MYTKPMKYAYLYLPSQMADWEPGLVIAELNTGRFFREKGKRLPVKTFGVTKEKIVTMGGLTIAPELTIDEIDPTNAALLLLPGGSDWQNPRHTAALKKAAEFLETGVLVAAICGATEAMASAGMLDDRPHTSNSLEYLKMAFPKYKGEKYYQQLPVVVDGNLITANNTAAVEFAYHILDKLDVFSERTLTAWRQRFETHDPKYILEILNSLPK